MDLNFKTESKIQFNVKSVQRRKVLIILSFSHSGLFDVRDPLIFLHPSYPSYRC